MVIGVFRFLACTRGRPRAMLFGTAGWLLLLLLQAGTLAMAQPLRDGLGKAADLPKWRLVLWDQIIRKDLWYFGSYSAPLGDINGDGFDDLAVSSLADTTFIFLGGNPMSHDHAFTVRGGSSGVAAADFNQDGKMDLVTAIDNWPPGEWPSDRRGAIRIYLQKDGPDRFIWEPDLLIEGEIEELVGHRVGSAGRNSVFVPDFNGDGYPDIVAVAKDGRDSVDWKAVLYLGGPAMDSRNDAEFRLGAPQAASQSYAYDILVGDINGDGCDDVLVAGILPVGNGVDYWDVFLGNPEASVQNPDHVLREDIGWCPRPLLADIMDIDGDGYDDILGCTASRLYGDALIFRGKPLLPDIIVPNDSILNFGPNPMENKSPQIACPVGDLNGDGLPDLILGWNTYFQAGGSGYYFHPGGTQFRVALGYFGTLPEIDFVVPGVYPAGDLNGDGYDDVITLGSGRMHGAANKFQIWIGARELQTAIGSTALPTSIVLELFPNPVPPGTRHVRISASSLRHGNATLELVDLLGHTLRRAEVSVTNDAASHTIDLTGIPCGVYLVSLHQGEHRLQQQLLLY